MPKAKIYTRTGDTGTTALVGGKRVAKHSARIETYGTLDELNSLLGTIAAHSDCTPQERDFITTIQNHLFDIGSYIACPPDSDISLPCGVTPQRMLRLEQEIDRLDKTLPPINRFILPGGAPLAAACHVARTVCRRAERRMTELNNSSPLAPETLAYINRLSDYLFTLARFNNIITDTPEIFWEKDC